MSRKRVEPKTPLGKRLTQVREELNFEEREPFAEALGLTVAAVGYYERGDRVPDAHALAAYHDRFAVNISWLVSGVGYPFDDHPSAVVAAGQAKDAAIGRAHASPDMDLVVGGPDQTAADAVEADLVEQLFDKVGAIYKAAGLTAAPRRIAREAVTLKGIIAARAGNLGDKEMVEAVMPQVMLEFRRRIEQSVAEPGTGKASAS